MTSENRSKSSDSDLNKDQDRGEISEDGFKDYDKEFHPADVDIAPGCADDAEHPPADKSSSD